MLFKDKSAKTTALDMDLVFKENVCVFRASPLQIVLCELAPLTALVMVFASMELAVVWLVGHQRIAASKLAPMIATTMVHAKMVSVSAILDFLVLNAKHAFARMIAAVTEFAHSTRLASAVKDFKGLIVHFCLVPKIAMTVDTATTVLATAFLDLRVRLVV